MGQSRGRRPEADEERRRWIAFAILTAVAGGTLLLGAGLSSSVPGRAAGPVPLALEAGAPAAETHSPVPAVQIENGESSELLTPSAMDRLADRTAADLERMAGTSRGWTNQLAVLCDTARVENLLESADNSRDLRLLPAYVGERTCFRICWGSYDSREQAVVSADMPEHLRRTFPESFPRRRDEVLQ